MRRRPQVKRRSDAAVPPPELCKFDGIADGYTTYSAWDAALSAWDAARRKWAAEHGVDVAEMPSEVGLAPFDFEAMMFFNVFFGRSVRNRAQQIPPVVGG